MKLRDWMAWKEIDDPTLAARVSSDRTTISRLRRGKQRPSWDLARKLVEISDGAVTLDDLATPLPIPHVEPARAAS